MKIIALTDHIACHPGSLGKHALEKTEDQKYREVWWECYYDSTYPIPKAWEQVDEDSAISVEENEKKVKIVIDVEIFSCHLILMLDPKVPFWDLPGFKWRLPEILYCLPQDMKLFLLW